MPDEEKPGNLTWSYSGTSVTARFGNFLSAGCPCPEELARLIKACDILLNNLRDANLLFEEGSNTGRKGVIEALNVVTEFLRFFPDTTDQRRPLVALLDALESLENGSVLPLLEKTPRPKGGRSPASGHGKLPRPRGSYGTKACQHWSQHKGSLRKGGQSLPRGGHQTRPEGHQR